MQRADRHRPAERRGGPPRGETREIDMAEQQQAGDGKGDQRRDQRGESRKMRRITKELPADGAASTLASPGWKGQPQPPRSSAAKAGSSPVVSRPRGRA